MIGAAIRSPTKGNRQEFLVQWQFDRVGPEFGGLGGPVPLARRGMGIPEAPGLYVVTAGPCLAHVGTSGRLGRRVRQLASLGTHRGSAEVLCAAFCTRQAPLVWWELTTDVVAARAREAAFKAHYGEPPAPREEFGGCRNGAALGAALAAAAGESSYEAGYITALFDIGEGLFRMFDVRFASAWRQIGVPPGPWPTHCERPSGDGPYALLLGPGPAAQHRSRRDFDRV